MRKAGAVRFVQRAGDLPKHVDGPGDIHGAIAHHELLERVPR